MHKYINKSDCTGCECCSQICPSHCITMAEDHEGFKYPEINEKVCRQCGLCVKACPVKLAREVRIEDIHVYACINKDKEILNSSSSGGVFSPLAESILDKGGVVFGAVYDQEFNVVHDCITEKSDIKKMRGSKYVQSTISESYQSVEFFLKEGRHVLFCGTPCQIAGLKSFLKDEYSELTTCDFICTGVPSPKVYRSYIRYIEELYGSKINDIQFRNKKNGWYCFGVSLALQNTSKYENRFLNPYIQGHYTHLLLRPSCYNCKFKGINTGADIKLADFWNVETVCPDFYNFNGVSLVLVGSQKGKELFQTIKDKLKNVEINVESAMNTNPSFTVNATIPNGREAFFAEISKNSEANQIYHSLVRHTRYPFYRKLQIMINIWRIRIKNRLKYKDK